MRSLIIKNWPLLLAIVITVVTQTIYWQAKPELGNCYDCGEYQDLANFISRDPKNIISDFRPPLYPIFMIINGLANPNPDGDFNLFVSQSFLLFATLLVFWSLIKKINVPTTISWIPMILLSLSPGFYSFTKFKLTETVNMLLLLALIIVAIRLRAKLSTKNILTFSALSFLAVFTRFANSYLVIVIPVVIGLSLGKAVLQKRTLAKLLILFLLIITPQLLYSVANYHRNYYFGLSGETGVNLLGKLVQYQLLPKTDNNFQRIVSKVQLCKGEDAGSGVFTCIWDFLPKNSFVSKYSVDNTYVDSFAKKYIILNLPTYVLKSIPIAFEAISTPADMYLILSQTDHPLFNTEKWLANIVHKLLTLWLFAILPIFLITFRKIIFRSGYFIVFLLLTVCLYYVAITGLAAINDYPRIITPVLPLFYTLVTITIWDLLNLLGHYKNRRAER